MSKRPIKSTRWLMSKFKANGTDSKTARIAINATMRAIIDTLMEGDAVNLRKIGIICFTFRKGRTIKGKVQTDSYPLKFLPSSWLRPRLKNVIPKHVLRRKQKFKPI